MRLLAGFLALLSALPAAADDYKAGWTFAAFYQEVSTCRSAITLPAARTYLEKGLEHKQPEGPLRSEVIALLPMFDAPASAACWCAVNEVAKSTRFEDYFGSGDFTARMTTLAARVDEPACGDKMRAAVSAFEKEEARKAIRLP